VSRSPSFARPSPRRRPRNGSGQVWAIVTVGLFLGAGAFGISLYVAITRQDAAVAGVWTAADDDEIYTGSILYMPDSGNLCRQLLFDNQNGQISDNGYVDCDRAAYHGAATPKQWSAARARVISSGFRDR
jgi:hypothetical protein